MTTKQWLLKADPFRRALSSASNTLLSVDTSLSDHNATYMHDQAKKEPDRVLFALAIIEIFVFVDTMRL